MPPNEHSMQALELRQISYNVHTCGRVDKLDIAIRQSQNDCHPIGHDSVMVGSYPIR